MRKLEERRPGVIDRLLIDLATAARSLKAAKQSGADREHLDKALRVLIDTTGHASTLIWRARMVGETGWRLCALGSCRRLKRKTCRCCSRYGNECAR